MPSLNWDAFERLPGAADTNFELLCRAAVRRTYGRFGDFNALANQPGVEFHLRLHTACSLGQPGDWFGWQCRWYDLPGGALLGSARRKKIEDAIAKAQRHLPSLTHWVLWTRRPLAADDQRWFSALSAPFRLVQWSAAEVEEHLTGEAEVLRATYFGDLVLTPAALAELHARAVAPVRRRWIPEAHQPVRAERQLRRMLGESDAWRDLVESVAQLTADATAAEADIAGLAGPLAAPAAEAVVYARLVSAALESVHALLKKGDFDALPQLLASGPAPPAAALASLPHRLRAARHAAALTVTNVLAAARHVRRLLDALATAVGCRLLAVTAAAGCGKTELAAQLTAPTADRPAGVLLHGRDLRAGDTLDNLASTVVIQGAPVRSVEALVAAVAAAGQRVGRRLPIIIDGLNEAEDPRDWKGGLASLVEILRPYPHVLVVCALRPAFAEEALPDSVGRLEIPGFGHDAAEAVRRYFAHYRINATDADLPWGLLGHPLTLRLFCEVTNPERHHEVGVEAMPGSLTDLFDRYLERAAERIAELAPRRNRYYKADVRRALVEIGTALWDGNTRQLALNELRRRLGDEGRPWEESLVRALEQDGVLLRDPRDVETGDQRVSVVYDRLAGHLIAGALIERHGRAGLQNFLREPRTVAALREAEMGSHPLGGDILIGLVGLTPQRLHGEQVWRMVEEPLRGPALRGAARLDGGSIDAATVEELAALAARPEKGGAGLLPRLAETRGVAAHPLNAEFLDRVLRPMPVADRDIHWTEWVRRNEEELLDDLRQLERRWQATNTRTPAERLRALWVMWLLTSTGRLLRDHATRSLYWFGRADPSGLFDLALDSLAINDPSVPERTMAAAFGVVMAHQRPDAGFAAPLRSFLTGLRDRLLGPTATHPTSHWLTRLHARGAWNLARAYYHGSLPDGAPPAGPLPFAPGPTVEPIMADDARTDELARAFGVHFENYTLGRLVPDRHNYDMDHDGYKAAVAHVRGTVWALGWRYHQFGALDNAIAETEYRRRNRGRIDRYGKKYGWVGFYTGAGQLADAGQLSASERLSDLGIDPSFPEPPPPAPVSLPGWAGPTSEDDVIWQRSGQIPVPDELLYRAELDGMSGPWVAVYAWLSTKDERTGRSVIGRLIALLVRDADADRLVGELLTPADSIRKLRLDAPDDHYTFAGEIPWSDVFGLAAYEGVVPYREVVEADPGPDIEVEILAHTYAWESYHSPLNAAGGAVVPSRAFSTALDLRSVPQSFDQVEPDGKRATKSFSAPAGFDGQVLYVREDLLKQYAADRRLVWWVWGERGVGRQAGDLTDELHETIQRGQDEWRIARRGEELCSLL